MSDKSDTKPDSPEPVESQADIRELTKGQFVFQGAEPLKIVNTDEDSSLDISPEEYDSLVQIGEVFKAYRQSVRELLEGKYKHLASYVPRHIREPGQLLLILAEGGLVVRFDKSSDEQRIYTGFIQATLPEAVRQVSQQLIHCQYENDDPNPEPNSGIEISLFAGNPKTGTRRVLAMLQVIYKSIIRIPDDPPQPPKRPYCLLSVINTLNVSTEIQFDADTLHSSTGKRMLSMSQIEIPVGWDCVEVYPQIDIDSWKSELAPLWAENDILASVATKQHREARLRTLDPNAESRRQFSRVLSEFRALLDSEPDREETLQKFIKSNPQLLCPAYDQMWPKLDLGAHETDFIFRDATSDYLLVEIERSTLNLFRKSDGHPTHYLNHAKGQIGDWIRYIEDNLSSLQREKSLDGLSSNPRSLIVIGRSNELTQENRRTLATMENTHPKMRIMTYDDVYDNFKRVITNLLGPLIDTGSSTEIYYLPDQPTKDRTYK